MGLCASADEGKKGGDASRSQSKIVEKNLSEYAQQEAEFHKLLLLGAGQSGKSTLFKQTTTIYGRGFTAEDRVTFRAAIENNIISSIVTLCEESLKYGPVAPQNEGYRTTMISKLKEDRGLAPEFLPMIKKLWADPGIQSTYEQSSKYQLNDSTKYYLDKIDQIVRSDYVPTEADVLRSRVPTTGIVESVFSIEESTFKLFDVGGQRSERKKWIHCFEKVTAVLFVAAMSEYDMVLYEDDQTNRMIEALDLFEEIANSEWFEKTAMILFLNKTDIFQDKIKRVPLSVHFPQFKGNNTSYEETSEFIRDMFETRNLSPEKKTVYTHFTCALAKDNVQAVFNAVRDIVIKKGLSNVGLM